MDEVAQERDLTPDPERDAALAHPDALVVAVRSDGRVAVTRGLPPGVAPDDLDAPVVVASGDEPVVAVFLDQLDDAELVALFGRFRDDRAALLSLPDPARGLGALGFGHWRARTRFCPRCAARLRARRDGRALLCDGCGTEHFPRLEPAIIVRVTDADDRLLLARQPTWPPGRFSVLAGFVDPGERIEDAIRREVLEEVGVRVADVDYVTSQPWPFPASLMIGWSAAATTTDLVLQEEEIAEAVWVTRDELREAMAAGEILVPPDVSIAHHLITDWLEDTTVRTWLDQR